MKPTVLLPSLIAVLLAAPFSAHAGGAAHELDLSDVVVSRLRTLLVENRLADKVRIEEAFILAGKTTQELELSAPVFGIVIAEWDGGNGLLRDYTVVHREFPNAQNISLRALRELTISSRGPTPDACIRLSAFNSELRGNRVECPYTLTPHGVVLDGGLCFAGRHLRQGSWIVQVDRGVADDCAQTVRVSYLSLPSPLISALEDAKLAYLRALPKIQGLPTLVPPPSPTGAAAEGSSPPSLDSGLPAKCFKPGEPVTLPYQRPC